MHFPLGRWQTIPVKIIKIVEITILVVVVIVVVIVILGTVACTLSRGGGGRPSRSGGGSGSCRPRMSPCGVDSCRPSPTPCPGPGATTSSRDSAKDLIRFVVNIIFTFLVVFHKPHIERWQRWNTILWHTMAAVSSPLSPKRPLLPVTVTVCPSHSTSVVMTVSRIFESFTNAS